MVGRFANFSGQEVIKILEKHFGFFFVSQKGSHVKLRKVESQKTVTVVVPDHKELAEGTLHNVLRQAGIESDSFLNCR